MTLGTENKKQLAILGGLVVVIVGILYYNSSSGDSGATTPTVTVPRAPASTDEIVEPAAATATSNTAARQSRTSITEFKPRVLGNRPGDKIDPNTIDPKLRLDLLAKVQAVEPIDAGRNLFQYGQAPAPVPALPTGVPKIQVSSGQRTLPTPPPVAPHPAAPAGPPPAPPINLKYYGYSIVKADGHKEAFLMDGDDVLMGTENQTLKQRYRIVKIALNSIDIEDLQNKNTQTLRIQDLPPS